MATELAGDGRLLAAPCSPESCRHRGTKPGPFLPLFCPRSTRRLLAFPLAAHVSGDLLWAPITRGIPALRQSAVRNNRGKWTRGGTSFSSPSKTWCPVLREGTTMLWYCWCHMGNVKGLSSRWSDLRDVQCRISPCTMGVLGCKAC